MYWGGRPGYCKVSRAGAAESTQEEHSGIESRARTTISRINTKIGVWRAFQRSKRWELRELEEA